MRRCTVCAFRKAEEVRWGARNFLLEQAENSFGRKKNHGVTFIFPLKRLKPIPLIFLGYTTTLHTMMDEGAHLSSYNCYFKEFKTYGVWKKALVIARALICQHKYPSPNTIPGLYCGFSAASLMYWKKLLFTAVICWEPDPVQFCTKENKEEWKTLLLTVPFFTSGRGSSVCSTRGEMRERWCCFLHPFPRKQKWESTPTDG